MIVDDRPLTTLHVDLGPHWRGGQNQALSLAIELRRMGHVAEIVALRGRQLAQRARSAGVTVHEVGGRLSAGLLIRRLGAFDVVHCHDAHSLTAARLAGINPVVSRRVAYPISKRRYLRTKCIIAVSQFVKDSVVACGIPDEQVEVIYDGVTVPDKPALVGPGLLVGSVGWLLPEKGQELLIRAMPEVLARHPHCGLILAGDGPSRRGLERLAATLGITASVQFAGIVDDVDQVYRSLNVFVFPSLAEPLGSSLLAAMSYGLPCVALARGAVPEVITDGENGLLADAPDPSAFANAILLLLDAPPLAARLAAAARQTIEDRFSVERMAELTVETYRRVLRGPG
jgi:glycosyltransferase involved in cell wall biosynthesis